ncbi:BON domain-containing protein [Roseobacteraceae bacterium S113]
MRKVLGGLVLVAGVGGLGWWGAENQAERMQAQIRGQADTIAAGALHGVQAITLGRDITLTGLVDSEDERAALIAAMEEINGQRQVRDALVTLPVADPYITRATRENDAQPMVSGSIPIEAARAEIGRAGGGGIAALSLASGAPEGWQDAYLAGLAGLLEMPDGDLGTQRSGTAPVGRGAQSGRPRSGAGADWRSA